VISGQHVRYEQSTERCFTKEVDMYRGQDAAGIAFVVLWMESRRCTRIDRVAPWKLAMEAN
jgi:hypothetical protein